MFITIIGFRLIPAMLINALVLVMLESRPKCNAPISVHVKTKSVLVAGILVVVASIQIANMSDNTSILKITYKR